MADKKPPPPPIEHAMPPQDRDFWIAITLWGGVFGTVFGYGLYALIEQRYWYGTGFTSLGLAGLVYLTAHLRGRRLTPRVGAMAAMLALTWALIAYQIWHEPTVDSAALSALQQKYDTAQGNLAGDQQTIQGLRTQVEGMAAERDQFKQQLANTQAQLQDTKHQLEAARVAAHQPPPPPLPEDQVPIRWQPLFQLNYNGEKKITSIRFIGETTVSDHMKDAYIRSNITGHKEKLKVWLPPDPKRYDADQVMPRGAPINLMLDLAPPLSVGDFLGQWGSFEFHVSYDDKEFSQPFNQSDVEQQLTAIGLFGPHIVPK